MRLYPLEMSKSSSVSINQLWEVGYNSLVGYIQTLAGSEGLKSVV